MQEIKSKRELINEQKEKLIKNISIMRDLWFTFKEIALHSKIFQQGIVTIVKHWLQYPISFEKSKQANEKLEAIISVKLEKWQS